MHLWVSVQRCRSTVQTTQGLLMKAENQANTMSDGRRKGDGED